ncbi:alpha/beta hydrolase [Bacillus canaveralius]|uniref:Alpha/beta hydrolase n=1 Tax=Bacillus canaveralius TaxID=1403243 RepID=A0A2N5GIF8_9BACI|nr:alpha/beta fold hydrolase [Bacillus canaveralius]PLR80774.1 alpha/beta hydrolase [Bacillus canaveralius]PLR98348.1 alpha/beta hydrolase [Bacillus canaveralius]
MIGHINIPWKNQMLAASIDFPVSFQQGASYPLVIICHGFTGSRIGVDRLFVKTAQHLNLDQCAVLRFDYAGCGESSGEYGKNGFCELIEQTEAVIDYAFEQNALIVEEVFLLGHSLGGAVALLTAAGDARVRNLILWSAVANPDIDIKMIVGKERLQELSKSCHVDYLGYYLTDNFFNSLEKYKPLTVARELTGNVLLIHGTNDDEIPVEYCRLYEKAFSKRGKGTCQRKEISGANHTFSDAEHFSKLISVTRAWIKARKSESSFSDVS